MTTVDLRRTVPRVVEDLIRVGRDFDGGYVIPKRVLEQTDVLIGLGVEVDWSFESEYLERSTAQRLVAVDGSVRLRTFAERAAASCFDLTVRTVRRNWTSASAAWKEARQNLAVLSSFATFFSHPKRHFVAKMLTATSSETSVTWAHLRNRFWATDPKQRLFIKMDIEGAEYDVLPDVQAAGDHVVGLIVEFHDLGTRGDEFHRCLEMLEETFCIVHVHGNNCAPLVEDTGIPSVLELTFLRRSLMSDDEARSVSSREYPLADLDRPNHQSYADYPLRFDQ